MTVYQCWFLNPKPYLKMRSGTVELADAPQIGWHIEIEDETWEVVRISIYTKQNKQDGSPVLYLKKVEDKYA